MIFNLLYYMYKNIDFAFRLFFIPPSEILIPPLILPSSFLFLPLNKWGAGYILSLWSIHHPTLEYYTIFDMQ